LDIDTLFGRTFFSPTCHIAAYFENRLSRLNTRIPIATSFQAKDSWNFLSAEEAATSGHPNIQHEAEQQEVCGCTPHFFATELDV
jgi:hypothetical protein